MVLWSQTLEQLDLWTVLGIFLDVDNLLDALLRDLLASWPVLEVSIILVRHVDTGGVSGALDGDHEVWLPSQGDRAQSVNRGQGSLGRVLLEEAVDLVLRACTLVPRSQPVGHSGLVKHWSVFLAD